MNVCIVEKKNQLQIYTNQFKGMFIDQGSEHKLSSSAEVDIFSWLSWRASKLHLAEGATWLSAECEVNSQDHTAPLAT